MPITAEQFATTLENMSRAWEAKTGADRAERMECDEIWNLLWQGLPEEHRLPKDEEKSFYDDCQQTCALRWNFCMILKHFLWWGWVWYGLILLCSSFKLPITAVVSGVMRCREIRSPLSARCEEMIARWHSGESSHPDRELLAAECPKIWSLTLWLQDGSRWKCSAVLGFLCTCQHSWLEVPGYRSRQETTAAGSLQPRCERWSFCALARVRSQVPGPNLDRKYSDDSVIQRHLDIHANGCFLRVAAGYDWLKLKWHYSESRWTARTIHALQRFKRLTSSCGSSSAPDIHETAGLGACFACRYVLNIPTIFYAWCRGGAENWKS